MWSVDKLKNTFQKLFGGGNMSKENVSEVVTSKKPPTTLVPCRAFGMKLI